MYFYLFINNCLKTPTLAVSCSHYTAQKKYGQYMALKSTHQIQYHTHRINFLFKFLFTQICPNTSLSKNVSFSYLCLYV
jgi:hypothetical protein